jgi:hypothetical protein
MLTLENRDSRGAIVSLQNEETVKKLLMFEDEDHAIDCDESAEKEERARRQRDWEENEFSRIQQLLDEPVLLRPDKVYIARLAEHRTNVKKDEFRIRFLQFLKDLTPGVNEPTFEICDDLFQLAVHAQQQLLAWEETISTTKNNEFRRSLKFLRAKAKWFARTRKLFEKQFRSAPQWTSSWVGVWIKAFDELQDLIAAQLRDAHGYLERLSKLSKLGRTDVCSHILLLNRIFLEAVIKKSSLSQTPMIAVAAFAHASKLLPQRDDANDAKGRHINNVKARLSRAAASKARLTILEMYLQSWIITHAPDGTLAKYSS